MNEIRVYYDDFARSTFARDYVHGNRRVERQHDFLRRAVPSCCRRILVIGCGYGDSSNYLARKITPGAEILAVDISSVCIAMARELHAHPNIEFRRLDVVKEGIPGRWDCIIFPDVYEHIPANARPILHGKLKKALTERGTILLTCPSPAHQDFLREKGEGLQVVDETVTLEDYLRLAEETDGLLTYYSVISVFRSGDYVHVVIERGMEKTEPLDDTQKIAIKGWESDSLLARVWKRGRSAFGIDRIRRYLRRLRLKRIAPSKQGPQ
jgi:SAM-dependent methyltransferase